MHTPPMDDEKATICPPGSVVVLTSNGERKTIAPCRLTSDDINDDGTINYPPSGECDCETPNEYL